MKLICATIILILIHNPIGVGEILGTISTKIESQECFEEVQVNNKERIRDISLLHPYFRDKIIKLIDSCKKVGIDLRIIETYRTYKRQNNYRSSKKGYTTLRGGESNHQYGLAVDLVPVVNTKFQWHNKRLWLKIGLITESIGLGWGGRWKKLYDPGHIEWNPNRNKEELQRGLFPVVDDSTKYNCLKEQLREIKYRWNLYEK